MSEETTKSFSIRQVSRWLAIIAVATIVIGVAYFCTCYKFVDSYELGYSFSKWGDSKIERMANTGYVKRIPFYNEVHTIDLRPMQVCLSANGRVLNCKLVEFNPDGLQTFLSWHGRDNYKGPGNTTVGIQGCTTQFCEILKVYAYDEKGTVYSFLKIVKNTTAEASK
jgi:hypothetical protein